MNFFGFKSAAARYAGGRPYFHAVVINRIKDFLSLEEPVAWALDVGCGTGLSSIALKEIAGRVAGVDAAEEMIAHAPRDARITYAVSLAEALPFGEHAFDLMTLSQVSHWLDRPCFFAEARRVLRPRSWLIAYDAYFTARTIEHAEFQAWHQSSYLKRFPSPPRAPVALSQTDVEGTGFQLHREERPQHAISFTPGQLVDYLLTQSNVIAVVEGGSGEIEEVRRWLTESTGPFFDGLAEASFLFDVPIWYLQVEAG
ncbi:MAG TPA: class I SAM-dependent methyltransferase [Pyrinomonadaceae bacterium]|jgi:SAM-dependent methyltransferase